jgi:hypothetical protein
MAATSLSLGQESFVWPREFPNVERAARLLRHGVPRQQDGPSHKLWPVVCVVSTNGVLPVLVWAVSMCGMFGSPVLGSLLCGKVHYSSTMHMGTSFC